MFFDEQEVIRIKAVIIKEAKLNLPKIIGELFLVFGHTVIRWIYYLFQIKDFKALGMQYEQIYYLV